MSPEMTRTFAIVFGTIILLGAVLITWAARRGGATRRAIRTAFETGPAGPAGTIPTDPWRRFTRALAAPYPRTEATRRGRVRTPADKLYYGYAIPGDLAAAGLFRHAVRRDWGVDSPDSAQPRLHDVDEATIERILTVLDTTVGELPQALSTTSVPPEVAGLVVSRAQQLRGRLHPPSIDAPQVAFDIGRGANLVRSCAVLGYVPEDVADGHLDLLGTLAAVAFDQWPEYGHEYLAGLARSHGRDRGFEKSVAWLTQDPESPWVRTPWPRGH